MWDCWYVIRYGYYYTRCVLLQTGVLTDQLDESCVVEGSGKSTLSKTILLTHPNFEHLSIDAIIYEYHGLYGRDYSPSDYSRYQEEAAEVFHRRLIELLREGKRNVILDRSFYSKADREEFRKVIEEHGGRSVLVYLHAKRKETLWKRIVNRRAKEINADSALDITQDILDRYWDGFEAPAGEEDLLIDLD